MLVFSARLCYIKRRVSNPNQGLHMAPKKLKFTLIGAGSASFAPSTISDILLNDRINTVPVSIALMDINAEAMAQTEQYAKDALAIAKRENVTITATTCLEKSLEDADYVVCAIDAKRFYYWSMDFHIPRRYGFRHIFGENGGPGGMFHALRNIPHIVNIARKMEQICPDAWILNYSNPEAKIVESVLRLTKTKAVGLCHGDFIGIRQVSQLLGIPAEEIEVELVGINHFGLFTQIKRRGTGEDLYPLLRERDLKIDLLAHWDDYALPRIFMRTFGLFPYCGTNHMGEYLGWADEFHASSKAQYFTDLAKNDPWNGGKVPSFIYSGLPDRKFELPDPAAKDWSRDWRFLLKDGKLNGSCECGIPIAEGISFDLKRDIGAVNVQNHGFAPNLLDGMVIEIGAVADAQGLHAKKAPELPTAIADMLNRQGAIQKLIMEAYRDQSRNKLLQALLIDPTLSNYTNAVALINEMCERQKEILPEMNW